MKRQLPNIITCCNLICGCIAVSAALMGNMPGAFLFVILGAVFDFFDGMTARLLHVSSPIGKELDSLADVITFGTAPAMMLFVMLHHVPYPAFLEQSVPTFVTLLPYLAFIMAGFSAYRLAKFNLDERQATSFIGLPTPANALFWGALIVGGEQRLVSQPLSLPLLLLLLVAACWLLVAELPMFALKFKHWRWQGNQVRYLFLMASLLLIIVLGVVSFAVIIALYIAVSLFTIKK